MAAIAHRVERLNWHRGLALGAPKQRYLRRFDGADLEHDDGDEDCCWRCCEDDYDERALDEEMMISAWEEGIRFAAEKARLGDRLPAAIRWAAAPAPAAPPPRHMDATLLARELAAHLRLVTATAGDLAFMHSGRFQAVWRELGGELAQLKRLFPTYQEHIGALAVALLFSPFWLRPLASWAPAAAQGPETTLASLIDHLFVAYPLPAFLQRAWSAGTRPALKWACWTVLLGQGGSLLRAAPLFGWVLHRQQVQHLLAAPADLSPVEACMWSEIAQHGGGRVELDRLRAHEAFRGDPTEDEAMPRPLFAQTAAWLARHRDELRDEQCGPLLDWAMHQHTEAERRGGAPFSWKGRTPRSALEQALAYQRQRELPYSDLYWRGHGWDWTHREGEDQAWSMRELTSGRQLYEEGLAMRHCVGGYAYACFSGRSAIFSLRLNEERRVTIELALAQRRVVQAKGERNRAARADEEAVIRRWLRTLAAPEV